MPDSLWAVRYRATCNQDSRLTGYLIKLFQEIVKIQDLGVGAITADKLKEAGFASGEAIDVAPVRELVDKANLEASVALKMRKVARQTIQTDFITAKQLWERREKVVSREPQPDLTTGIEILDKMQVLRFGQFAVLQGKPSHPLSLLLCVRAVLPKPLGPNSDVLFIDGGNIFDAYSISERSVEHELDSERVLERIRISRAFTHHQLTMLITEKLPVALDELDAKLVVVSDITQLYCDPDIQGEDKLDALRIFEKTARFLRALAEQKHALIVATNLHSRNSHMDKILLHGAHVSVKLEDRDTFIELTVVKHPRIPQLKAAVPSTFSQGPSAFSQTLERYL